MDKENVHVHCVIPFIHEEEWNSQICDNVDEPEGRTL
jgi:hypothetical protein